MVAVEHKPVGEVAAGGAKGGGGDEAGEAFSGTCGSGGGVAKEAASGLVEERGADEARGVVRQEAEDDLADEVVHQRRRWAWRHRGYCLCSVEVARIWVGKSEGQGQSSASKFWCIIFMKNSESFLKHETNSHEKFLKIFNTVNTKLIYHLTKIQI